MYSTLPLTCLSLSLTFSSSELLCSRIWSLARATATSFSLAASRLCLRCSSNSCHTHRQTDRRWPTWITLRKRKKKRRKKKKKKKKRRRKKRGKKERNKFWVIRSVSNVVNAQKEKEKDMAMVIRHCDQHEQYLKKGQGWGKKILWRTWIMLKKEKDKVEVIRNCVQSE